MYSSPFYANRMFDSKYSLSTLPTYSHHNFQLSKQVNKETGKITYQTEEEEPVIVPVSKPITLPKNDTFTISYNGYIQEFLKGSKSGKDYIFGLFHPQIVRYSNNKLYENSKLLPYNLNFFTRLDSIRYQISGTIKNNEVPIEIKIRTRFLTKKEDKGKTVINETEPIIFENSLQPILLMDSINVQKVIPDSDQHLFSFVPSLLIFSENEPMVDVDLCIKLSYQFSFIENTGEHEIISEVPDKIKTKSLPEFVPS